MSVAWVGIATSAASYLPEIIKLAKPLLTRVKGPEPPATMTAQIAELQHAVTANAEAIGLLVNEMQARIDGAQRAADELAVTLRRTRYWAIGACVAATLAIAASVAMLLT